MGTTLHPSHHNQYPYSIVIPITVTFTEIDTRQLIRQYEHFQELSKQLANFQLNGHASSDMTLVTTVDKRKFPVHRNILAFRSTVFAAMFGNKAFKENQTGLVEIDDISGEVMEALLKYIYSGDIQRVEANSDALLQAADKVIFELLYLKH